jgi:hypothetical protein
MDGTAIAAHDCCPFHTSTPIREINVTSAPRDTDQASNSPADEPAPPVSKPIGDAIPTPVEPGLDQPLPEKPADEPVEKKP